MLAEVDGNRTRRSGFTRSNRFEGGGVHQALGHLRPARYRAWAVATKVPPMKRLLMLVVLVALASVAARRLSAN